MNVPDLRHMSTVQVVLNYSSKINLIYLILKTKKGKKVPKKSKKKIKKNLIKVHHIVVQVQVPSQVKMGINHILQEVVPNPTVGVGHLIPVRVRASVEVIQMVLKIRMK